MTDTMLRIYVYRPYNTLHQFRNISLEMFEDIHKNIYLVIILLTNDVYHVSRYGKWYTQTSSRSRKPEKQDIEVECELAYRDYFRIFPFSKSKTR